MHQKASIYTTAHLIAGLQTALICALAYSLFQVLTNSCR